MTGVGRPSLKRIHSYLNGNNTTQHTAVNSNAWILLSLIPDKMPYTSLPCWLRHPLPHRIFTHAHQLFFYTIHNAPSEENPRQDHPRTSFVSFYILKLFSIKSQVSVCYQGLHSPFQPCGFLHTMLTWKHILYSFTAIGSRVGTTQWKYPHDRATAIQEVGFKKMGLMLD